MFLWILKKIDGRPLEGLFSVHDGLSNFLARYVFTIKRLLLVCAHLLLFGFLFPYLREGFGNIAIALLFIILFMSPLSKIFRMRLLLQLMSLRRELGIMMAYAATVHGIGYLLDPQWFELSLAPYWQQDIWGISSRYLFGIVAYILTLPLLFTSNNLSQLLLGAQWKKLHRIVYLVFFLVLLHYFLPRPGRSELARVGYMLSLVVFAFYLFLKALAWKNFWPALREVNVWVATRYALYKQKQSISPPLS